MGSDALPFGRRSDAENVRFSVFLLIGASEGIRPEKLCYKTPVGKIKGAVD